MERCVLTLFQRTRAAVEAVSASLREGGTPPEKVAVGFAPALTAWSKNALLCNPVPSLALERPEKNIP